jgi:hypothetical protein
MVERGRDSLCSRLRARHPLAAWDPRLLFCGPSAKNRLLGLVEARYHHVQDVRAQSGIRGRGSVDVLDPGVRQSAESRLKAG